jgi:hypothetical protein
MADFVRTVARAVGIPRLPMGSTTWGNEEAERGIEADECFYFASAKIDVANEAIAPQSNDPSEYPPPDLAVEFDLGRPLIDRPSIYATIGVAEVRRFERKQPVVEQLQGDGTYGGADTSRFLPISTRDLLRWLVSEDASDRSAWDYRLDVWARAL